MTKTSQVETLLSEISRNIISSTLGDEIANLTRQNSIANSSKLGVNVGQEVSGFSSLIAAIDDVIPGIIGSEPIQTTDVLSVAQLLRSGSGLNELKKQVTTDKADIDAITGSTASTQPAFRDVVISAPFPEAMANALKVAVPTAAAATILSAVNKNVSTNIPLGIATLIGLSAIDEAEDPDFVSSLSFNPDDLLRGIIGSAIGSSTTMGSLLSSVAISNIGATNAALNLIANGFKSVIENAVEQQLKPSEGSIQKLAQIGGQVQTIKKEDLVKINTFLSNNNIVAARKIVRKYSDLSDVLIEEELRKINNRATNNLQEPVVTTPIEVKNNTADWSETNTSSTLVGTVFNRMSSSEEIQTIISNMNRESTEIIITATDTQPLGSPLRHHRQFVAEYGYGIPYHFLITRGPSIWTCRPLDVKPRVKNDSSLAAQHYTNSIVIALEGGVYEDDDTVSYTNKQMSALYVMTYEILKIRPGMQIFGVNDITDSLGQPYFDVVNRKDAFRGHLFSGNVKNYNPLKEPPLSQNELVSRRSEGN